MKYKGYDVVQESNHHIWIGKDGKVVCHAQCNKPLTEDELKEHVDAFMEFMEFMKKQVGGAE